MDDQTAEKMAKLAADNLRLRDEVKLLRRQLTRAVPVGTPDRKYIENLEAELAGVRENSVPLAVHEALQKCCDELDRPYGRDDLSALEEQLDAAMASATESKELRELLEKAQGELARLQALNGGADTRIERLAELESEVALLRSTQNEADENLVAELEFLRSTQAGPRWIRGAVQRKAMEGDLAEERLGELEALQKRYDQLREEWDAERELTFRLHAEVGRLQRVAPVAEEPPPEWMRELWSDIYKHAYVAEVKSPAADADKALSKAKTRFGPEPLDTPEDTDEG